MKSAADALTAAWSLAGSVPHRGDRRAVRLEGGARRTWATLSADGIRGVLIEAPPDELLGPTVAAIENATGAMHAEVYPFTGAARDARGFLLECGVAALLPVFVGFCEPFITRVESGEAVGVSFQACFEEFKVLLAAETEEMTRADIGLLGELIILRDMIHQEPASVGYWARPTLERHDFRNGTTALEVKTSLRAAAAKPVVRIAAIDQLEPPEGGALYLALVRLERDPGGQFSVPRVLEGIRSALHGQALELFARKTAGTVNANATEERFALLEMVGFRIEGDFPRLTPSRLTTGAVDSGVGNVKYDLDLSMAAGFRCDLVEVYRALRGVGVA